MTRVTCAVAAVVVGLMTSECLAQTADISFATLPNGVQVPPSLIAGPPGWVAGDQFAALGIHFSNSGILSEDAAGVWTTAPDGWSRDGSLNCAPCNLVVQSNTNTLTITFDVPQTSVQMDLGTLINVAPQVSITLKQVTVNGTAHPSIPLTLTQAVALLPCSSVPVGGLCGRFEVSAASAGTGARFNEIDITSDPNGPNNPTVDNVTFTPASSYPGPIAKASPISAMIGTTVTLDGSSSINPAGGSLTYSWTDPFGKPPLISSPLTGATPTLTLPSQPGTYTVQLTVTDPFGLTGTTTVPIFTNPAPPVADVAPVAPVAGLSVVTLDGSTSFDPNGLPLTYLWTQTAGPTVTLSDPLSAKPTFTSPGVPSGSIQLQFILIVNDGFISSDPVSVTVTVTDFNGAPIANAGLAQTVLSGALVTLNGAGSSDPDNNPITYQWTQVAGTTVTLSNPTVASPQFVAPPEAPGGQEVLTFQLVVTDQPGSGNTPLPSTPATVFITVQDPFAPPNCDKAGASLTSIWPPDRRMVGPLSIINTTDNAPGRVTITTIQIFQDEPTLGPGIGETQSPQATILTDGTFFLRAARLGTGDGRVYHISFKAANGFGGSCTGEVNVCVPLKGGKGTTCVDQGALYNSTQ